MVSPPTLAVLLTGTLVFLLQFSQLVLGDVELLGGGSYTLCTDGPLLVRQVLHPEASRKV